MFPASKDMDEVHSGTGVFYQAMPAVGADGKNVMKLIPVQMVNGRFVQTQMSRPVTVNISSAPVQVVKKATLNPSATQQVVRKQVSVMNVLPNQGGLEHCNPLNKWIQQQTVNLMTKVPLMATPATNCGSVKLPSKLPVTVKSPALPRGQYLQIPPHAQVRTVPASELSPGVKKQIFTSSASSSPGSGLPSVVYVSPIMTVHQGVTPSSESALHSLKLLSRTSTSCGLPSKGSKRPHLKLIPKVSQRPNSPIKWVIEEEDSSTSPNLNPLQSPSVTSEILQAVADREKDSKPCDVTAKLVSQSSQSKSGQGQDNALVMCNGKVFFVAKNSSALFKTGKSDSPTAATKSYEFNKTSLPSSQQSAAPEIRQDLRIIIPDESDEVIDLCDDDAQDDSSQQAASANMSAVPHLDEDNVIFVSYIPPRSESTQDLVLKTQMAQQKSLDGPAGADGRQETSAHKGRSTSVSTVTSVHDNEGSNIDSQQSASTLQLERMEVESPTDLSTSNSSSGISSQIQKQTHQVENSMNPAESWTSSPAPESRQMADHLLRRAFGITADVRICLPRIDEATPGSVAAELLQMTAEAHQEPTSSWKEKEHFLRDLYSPQETDSLIGNKRVKGQELPADPATPLKCSHFKLNSKHLSAVKKCPAGQSSFKGTSRGVETEPVIGYVEPIGEDFLSTDENDIPNSQDTQTQTCVDLNANTRRIGRTRKRTVCPCCVPGTQGPAVKSSAKSSEAERKWAWTAEQTSRKGGRTKAPRKDVRTSGRISCLTAKNKQNCETHAAPAGDSLTSVDYDDLKQQEQIKRLKELLKEKEAALELLRNSMSRN